MFHIRNILCICLALASFAHADDSSTPAISQPPSWPELTTANYIDDHIFGRLRELRIVPSPLASDTEFLRRVTLTTTGQLPTADEVRSFVADRAPDKRARKIDELLSHKLHAAVWANRLSEMTGNSLDTTEGPDELKPKRAKMWHDWLRARFETNTPYDVLVRQILTATSRGEESIDAWIDEETSLVRATREGFSSRYADRPTLDLFWRREAPNADYPVEALAERIASNFMGVRINCAKCHQHPFDRWTQDDYRSFVNVFSQVRFDMSPALRTAFADRLQNRRDLIAAGEEPGPPPPRLREVYVRPSANGPSSSPPTPAPKSLGGQEIPAAASDYRATFMDWLGDPQNPFFARNIVNRVWAHHFGRGLVEPLDGFSTANPPSNPELLDALATDFVRHGYDLRHLERLILNSSTWQLSSEPNATNTDDHTHFARAYVRMPPAETVIDMWHGATGIVTNFGDDVPAGVHAVEIGPNRLSDKRWDRVLKLFGRSARTQTCDCEPPAGPSIRQTLAFMNDPGLVADLSTGRLKTLLDSKRSDDEILDELFLSTLSRWPTAEERTATAQALQTSEARAQFWEDALWGLLNTREFITNH
jgi:hypothetical protein